MFKQLVALISPPRFDDERKTAAVVLPYNVVILTLSAITLSAIPTLLLSGSFLTILPFFVATIGGSLLALWRLRLGYIIQTSIALVVLMMIAATVANFLWNSSSAPAVGAYTVIILFSGMMLGKRAAIYTALFSIVVVISLGLATTLGLLPTYPPVATPLARAAVHALYYLEAALVLYAAIGTVNKAVVRLQENERQLTETLTTLQSTSVSKNYIDNILHSMNNLLLVMDANGIIQTVNPRTLKVLGYRESDLVGKPLKRFYDSNYDASLQAANEDSTRSNEAELIAFDGQRIPVAYTQSVMQDPDGKMTGVVLVAQDITERRMMEEERRIAEQERLRNAMRYRALFEQTNDAVFLIDLNGKHIAVNQRAADLTGYSVEELLHMSFRELVPIKERGRKSQIMDAVLIGKPVATHERTFGRKDGSEFAAEVNIELVYDADNKPMHLQSVVRDITRRKHNEQQLAYQVGLLQNVNDAIISTSMDNVIQSWNRAAEQVYGWKADEVIGKKLSEVIPTEFESDSEDFIKQQYIVRGYWRSEVKQRARDGRGLIMLSSVSILRDNNNQLLGTVTVNHDITARKHAEMELQERIVQLAALRQVDVEINSSLKVDEVLTVAINAIHLLSGADDGYIALNHDDQLTVRETFGGYDERLPRGSVIPVKGLMNRILEQRQPELITDMSQQPSREGSLAHAYAQMMYPMFSRGQLVGIINLETKSYDEFTPEKFEFLRIVASRISIALENAQLFQVSQTQLTELQELYNKVFDLEKLKTDMIRVASHDLRNPVGVVKGYIEILRDDLKNRLTDDEVEYFDTMKRSTLRIQQIINDILSLERLESGAIEVIDLGLMVNTILTETKAHSDEKHQQVISTIAPAQMLIEADPAQVREAVINLVDNAIKYTPEEGCVQVRLNRNGVSVHFEVEDNGYGIPAELQPNLFEPFYRAKHKDVMHIEGTGLGLHLVRNIIERFGGKIGFESELKRGSKFWFDFPLIPGT